MTGLPGFRFPKGSDVPPYPIWLDRDNLHRMTDTGEAFEVRGKNPKKVGSSVASIIKEYGKSIM